MVRLGCSRLQAGAACLRDIFIIELCDACVRASAEPCTFISLLYYVKTFCNSMCESCLLIFCCATALRFAALKHACDLRRSTYSFFGRSCMMQSAGICSWFFANNRVFFANNRRVFANNRRKSCSRATANAMGRVGGGLPAALGRKDRLCVGL